MLDQWLMNRFAERGVWMDLSKSFFELASSKVAMIVYVIVLFLIMAVMVVTLMTGDLKKGSSDQSTNIVIQQSPNSGAMPVAPAVPVAPAEEKPEGEGEDAEENAPRFCMLSRIDENRAKYDQRVFDKDVSLKKFCDSFRNYAASELRLYYDIKDIRRFVAGLAVSPILILQGMSGTGKTSLAHAMGSFLENTSTVIPVQPMWKECRLRQGLAENVHTGSIQYWEQK